MTTDEAKAQIVEKGSNVIEWLLAGPAAWEKTKRPYLPPEQIGASVQIAAMAPATLQHAWIHTQQVVAQTAVSIMVAELVEWARVNRPDFFLTVGQLVEEAVHASEPT